MAHRPQRTAFACPRRGVRRCHCIGWAAGVAWGKSAASRTEQRVEIGLRLSLGIKGQEAFLTGHLQESLTRTYQHEIVTDRSESGRVIQRRTYHDTRCGVDLVLVDQREGGLYL